MKGGPSELGPNSINTSSKIAKITKSQEELFAEVFNGQFEDFREWLIQSMTTSLDFSQDTEMKIIFSNLGKALQGTAVTKIIFWYNKMSPKDAKDIACELKGSAVAQLILVGNRIGDQGAKDFVEGLKGTAVTQIIWSLNEIGDLGAKNFAEGLQGTNVTQLILRANNIGDGGAKGFALGLQGSNVTQVDLSNNRIGNQGAIDVITALASSYVICVNLSGNAITMEIALDIAKLIKNTNLLDLKLPFTHPAIKGALKRNQDTILIAHEVARLCSVPQSTKEKMMPKATFTLSENASNEEQIQYAGGILANPRMPLEIAQNIVSFLPMMNANKVKDIFNVVAKKPPTLIQSKQNEVKKGERHFLRTLSVGSPKP